MAELLDFRARQVSYASFGYGLFCGLMIAFGVLAVTVHPAFGLGLGSSAVLAKMCHESLPLK